MPPGQVFFIPDDAIYLLHTLRELGFSSLCPTGQRMMTGFLHFRNHALFGVISLDEIAIGVSSRYEGLWKP